MKILDGKFTLPDRNWITPRMATAKSLESPTARLDSHRSDPAEAIRTDAEIGTSVMDAINCITTVPVEAIQVEVRNGWVFLRGILSDWGQRDTAAYVARHLVGVRDVVNCIIVNRKPIPV